MATRGASSGGGSGRLQRMEAQVQRVIAEMVPREVRDPRVGAITVTQVQLARDLSEAKIWYVPFGTKVPEGMHEGLIAAAGFLRGEVGRRVGLRHAPRLTFIHDDSIDRAAHLTALIDAANKPRE